MLGTPCRNCDKRTPDCHASCELYKNWRAEYSKETGDLARWKEATRQSRRSDNPKWKKKKDWE